jgi:predicted RNA-binding Zn ribbon-like protein
MARFQPEYLTCKVAFDSYNETMSTWISHRFSGGLLALDLANTVVWSDVKEKRADRFSDRTQISGFAAAATQFRRAEVGGRILVAPDGAADIRHLLQLRNVIDTWLRPGGQGLRLQVVFDACARASHAQPSDETMMPLGEACARSAMRFLAEDTRNRLKTCPSCRWLYLDNSKNQSRQWCDMKVCGNRAKARTFYAKQKLSLPEVLDGT